MKRILVGLMAAGGLFGLAACGGSGSTAGVDAPSSAAATPRPSQGLVQPGEAAAKAFVAFAETGTDTVPWAASVTYSIGGVRVSTFGRGAGVAGELSTCLPGKSEVEGHTCPVSPLKTVSKDAKDAVIEYSLPEHVGCNIYSPPKAPEGSTPVVIRPPEDQRDCTSDFAVTLEVDASGNVAGVDFSLSGP